MFDPKILQTATDGANYEVLYEVATLTAGMPQPSVEIGVREGGSSELILRATKAQGGKRLHIAIDPWGGMPYRMGTRVSTAATYPDAMRRRASAQLYRIAFELDMDLLILPMCDTDYMGHFAAGVPFYRNQQREDTTAFSLIYVDGPHTVPDVEDAIEFFGPRVVNGGYMVFDDVNIYEHQFVESFLEELGFVRQKDMEQKGIKAVHKKES